ncbi:MAG: hypothetical protein ACD_6C00784G0004 [uncultured bacterium]|nr:MAG: hypothetical protein ACD_6C00784G0004 [uncultured bacterium]
MNDFEKWFEDQDFYTNMRFIHGDKLFDKDGDVYRVLPVQMVYQGWSTQRQRSKDEFVALTQEWHTKGWNARQGEIDELKAQLNNMEACYVGIKKINDEQSAIIQGHFAARQDMQKRIDELEGALNEVKEWKSHPVGHETSFGSWGVRDFYRGLAEKALRGES